MINIQHINTYTGHRHAIYSLVAYQKTEFLTASGDGWVVKWDVEKSANGEAILQVPHTLYALNVLSEQKIVLAGGQSGNIYVCNLLDNKLIKTLSLKGDVFTMVSSADNLFTYIGTSNGYLYIIDNQSFDVLFETNICQKSIRDLSWLSDIILIASCSDGTIKLFDTNVKKVISEVESNQPSVFSALYLKEYQKIISGGRDAQLYIYDYDKVNHIELILKVKAHLFTINKIISDISNDRYITASRDKTIKIWNAKDDVLLKVIDNQKFVSHTHSINTIMLLPERNLLISAGDDKRIMLWKQS